MAGVNVKIDDDLHRLAMSKAKLRGMKWWQYVEDAIREKAERDDAEDRGLGRGRRF